MAKIDNLKRYPIKGDENAENIVIGTCRETGKTRNFPVCCSEYENTNDGDTDTIEPNDTFKVFSFEFNDSDFTSDINSETYKTDSFILTNATEHSLESIKEGKYISSNNISRYGFIIQNTNNSNIDIYNELGLNVTNIEFEKHYDSVKNTTYFVSKEFSIPNNSFYKLNF